MATILLSAAGGAIGAGFGGTVLGLSGAVIGRALGATLGQAIDQRLLGVGSQSVETGRVERLRLSTASEGEAVGILWGRMRVAGQVIWATRFFETRTVQKQGGKGAPRVTNTSYSYSVSLAIALCEGEILRVGRIWADGVEVARESLNLRVYAGSEAQLPDPKIEAVEGAGRAPAYRGIAYVVIEDLALAAFGNRVPQFSFEVVRTAQGPGIDAVPDLVRAVQGVALIPGTGEYSLSPVPVYQRSLEQGAQDLVAVNQNAPGGLTDFSLSLRMLEEELPACGSVSLVVSWFGDDLRCAQCSLRPKVADATVDGENSPWRVSSLTRQTADELPRLGGRGAVYGGTPSDASVIGSLRALRAAGKFVTFYPFILMEQMVGNLKPDPWTGTDGQPPLPWRGRITLSLAPGLDGSPDGSSLAEAQVAAFFGAAAPGDFTVDGQSVTYSGPPEWSMRRFILHYAHLCAAAGGVDAFCIGTEMVALTQIRGPGHSFPAVSALRQLAADVRAILGNDCRIGYAADWSEYFGYHPGNGDLFFHLDPLWSDPNIDFIGIDNYMPLSDWRDEEGHADEAATGAIYDLGYLQSNIEGGEGYDWYYAQPAHREAQIRTPITDGAHGEPWVWRYKDIRNWWDNLHHDRIGGVRHADPSPWVARAKPVWFTELGCAAIDKGTNQPNKFLDPKSSESSLPYFSDGRRDELIQMQYLRAISAYWEDTAHNPLSEVYGGRMVDTRRSHVWAWDARPYPQFPQRADLWSDGENYARGHWLSGRATAQPLASVVAEICTRAGVREIDTSRLFGLVRGYVMAGGQSARAALQVLSLAYGFEALERDGKLVFRPRDGRVRARLGADALALGEGRVTLETARAAQAEVFGRIRIGYVEADGAYEARAVEAIHPDETASRANAGAEMALALTRGQAQGIAERWLTEARVARDGARFTLPPSWSWLGAGDVVALEGAEGTVRRYRLDRVERAEALTVEAVRVEAGVYVASDEAEGDAGGTVYAAPVPVTAQFLDLPLMRGDENPVAPHLAAYASPWPGSVAVYSSVEDAGYGLNTVIEKRAVIGTTLTPLLRARSGCWDRGAPLRLRLHGGALESVSAMRLFGGANLVAIGESGTQNWELLQFARAVPVGPGIWDVDLRLRGQLGTDALMPEVWPVGSQVVLIDEAVEQISLTPAARGLARHYRIGPAQRSYDDLSFRHSIAGFQGVGLRPYSPCHLHVQTESAGLRLKWVRRSRIDGDGWEGEEVPLGEDRESYLVRVITAEGLRREARVTAPEWFYGAAEQMADGVAGQFRCEVSQISASFGAGPAAVLEVVVAG